jgi:uncharacterized protein YbjT (DUF2867 family)
MDSKKIVLVTGATGAQGGSVAKALSGSNEFSVRVFTRNASCIKAVKLREQGAEVVEGDMDDKQSLLRAMKDCYAVFGVTDFWEHYEKEYHHGKNLVDAVKESGIRHFVFSTLESFNKLSNGEFNVPHHDIKATLQDYTKAQGIPATFTHLSFYYENFLDVFSPRKLAGGDYFFGFPQGHTKLPAVSVDDLGPVLKMILEHPQEYIGRTVDIVGEDMTCNEYAAILSKVLHTTIRYKYIPRDDYASLGFPAATWIANIFEVRRLYAKDNLMGLIETYGLNPSALRFEAWVQKNKERFGAVLAAQDVRYFRKERIC